MNESITKFTYYDFSREDAGRIETYTLNDISSERLAEDLDANENMVLVSIEEGYVGDIIADPYEQRVIALVLGAASVVHELEADSEDHGRTWTALDGEEMLSADPDAITPDSMVYRAKDRSPDSFTL